MNRSELKLKMEHHVRNLDLETNQSSAKKVVARDVTAMVPLLLKWFAHNARDLPWRRTHSPYAIWVSEVMLQQTQVKTVVPYFERWMKALPTIESLARARSEKLHKLWEGLGYYTRVRNMQRAARDIVEKHGGTFPSRYEDVLGLPGIGRYTAGAICSIAFHQPVPVLDGNVIRVLTRVLGIGGNTRAASTRDRLWRIAEQLAQYASSMGEEPGLASQLNQALMELGALICKPRAPGCDACPLARSCLALLHNRIAELPNLTPRPRTTRRRFVAFVIERRGRFLVRQRPPGEVNAHLWEFPNMEVSRVNGGLKRAARAAVGCAVEILGPICTIKHSITRFRITVEAFRAALPVGQASCLSATAGQTGGQAYRKGQAGRLSYNGLWLPFSRLNQLAFTSAHKRILERARMDAKLNRAQ